MRKERSSVTHARSSPIGQPRLLILLEAVKMAGEKEKPLKLSELSLQQLDRFKGQLNEVSSRLSRPCSLSWNTLPGHSN